MSTTLIDGAPAGPDEAGGQYRNRILTDRATWWAALGGRQGVLRGFGLTTIGGQMALAATKGLGVVEERDVSGDPNTGRGYAVWADADQTVSFDPASASDRNDAVALAFVDVSVGVAAVGTETTAVGGQIVVVPGVSGVTTPRTDADISAAVGSGGWVRLADVLVESTDTEIQAANITPSAMRSAAKPIAIVERSNAQSIPHDTGTPGEFDTTIHTDGHITIGSSSITIEEPGVYDLAASVALVATAGQVVILNLEVDGTTVARVTDVDDGQIGVRGCTASALILASGGEEVVMEIWQNAGSAQDTHPVRHPRMSVAMR